MMGTLVGKGKVPVTEPQQEDILDALSIPGVLRCVLENLSTDELASVCRLVNLSWNYESCKILQSRVTIRFKSWQEIRDFNNTFESSIENVSIRFERFEFPRELFVSVIADNAFGHLQCLDVALQNFYKIQGSYVLNMVFTLETIHLAEGNYGPHRSTIMTLSYNELFKMVFKYFPNLRKLQLLIRADIYVKVEPIEFDMDEFAMQYDISQMKRLNLERVTLYCIENAIAPTKVIELFRGFQPFNMEVEEDSSEILTLTEKMVDYLAKAVISLSPKLKVLSTCDASEKQLMNSAVMNYLALFRKSLKDLVVLNLLDDSHILQLNQMENLVNFTSEFNKNAKTSAALTKLCLRFKKSLKTIRLNFTDSCAQLPLSSTMIRLEHITLENYEGDLQWKLLPALKGITLLFCDCTKMFTSLTSYLERLADGCPSCNEQFQAQVPIVRPWNIETLDVIKRRRENGNFIEILFNMPCCFLYNLSSLSLSMFDAIPLSRIFESCGLLRKLSLKKCGGITDEAICGIRKSLLNLASPIEKINQYAAKEILSWKILEIMRNVRSSGNHFRDFPFIGNLKYLQELRIQHGEFSDVCVLYGICSCENLRSVVLESYLMTWRAEVVIKAVLQDIINVDISVSPY